MSSVDYLNHVTRLLICEITFVSITSHTYSYPGTIMYHQRHKIFIGELLAALPLWEINLRSKVVVFWKALLVLTVTALSVRHLSPKPGGPPHLKNVSQIPIFFGWPCFGSPDGTHYHTLSLPPNSTKIAEFFLAPAGGLTVHSPPTGW